MTPLLSTVQNYLSSKKIKKLEKVFDIEQQIDQIKNN